MKNLEKKVNLLTAYAILSTCILGLLVLFSFRQSAEKSFDIINVKRINVLAEDGSLRMVISNESKQHPGRLNGKDLLPRARPAGIIFFNNEGNECGGLIHYAEKEGEAVQSGMSFTMDQYQNDQVVQLVNEELYQDGKVKMTRGLVVNEIRPGANLGETITKMRALKKITDTADRNEKIRALIRADYGRKRLLVGKNKENEYGLFLFDSVGKPRFRIYVDKEGSPKIQAINAEGEIRNLIDQ